MGQHERNSKGKQVSVSVCHVLRRHVFFAGVFLGWLVMMSSQSSRETVCHSLCLRLSTKSPCRAETTQNNHSNSISVDETEVYAVRSESVPAPNSLLTQDCQLVFRSSRQESRMCVLQRRLTFDHCHLRLELYGGTETGVKEPSKTADCDRSLQSAEWCTSAGFLTLGLRRTGPKPNLQHVHIDLLVYSIHSKHRTAYMDRLPYCGSSFELDNSRVTVYNLNPNNEVQTPPFSLCILTFRYTGPDDNRKVCAKLVTKRDGNCDVDHMLTVLDADSRVGHVEDKVHVCKKSSGDWCSSGTGLKLQLTRQMTEKEVAGMFAIIVRDQKTDTVRRIGNNDSVSNEDILYDDVWRGLDPMNIWNPDEERRENSDESTSPSTSTTIAVGVTVGVVGLVVGVLIVLLVVIIRRRAGMSLYERPMSRGQRDDHMYKEVTQPQPEPPATGNDRQPGVYFEVRDSQVDTA